MAKEVERKFLVKNNAWKTLAEGELYRQGYLSTSKERTVRVRLADQRGFLTVKGLSVGISRDEYEYEIPASDAAEMLGALCLKPLIEKKRYCVRYREKNWEIDEFLGENLGLIVAEVELGSPDEQIALPDWIGQEVSHDPRYFNSSLIACPYGKWSAAEKCGSGS